jgi:Zn-dependent protease
VGRTAARRGPQTAEAERPTLVWRRRGSGYLAGMTREPEQARPQPPRTGGRRTASPLRGIRFGRVAGIELLADWSLIIIFVLVLVNLGLGVFPAWHPDWSPALVWGVAFGAAVLFFVSVLLHELSHALVGRAFGIPVRRITLFIFGGMAHTECEPPSPKAELLMAAAGPITSIGIGVAASAGAAALMDGSLDATTTDPLTVLATLGPVGTLLLWLGPINILLGVFNLVPGFPLDGGRVLRAALWAATKDLEKATRWASWGGQLVGWLLIALGITSLFAGGLGQGLWLMLIGWFLLNAARASYRQTVVEHVLSGAHVSELMRRSVDSVPPELPVSALVSDHVMRTDQQCFPVVIEGHLEGLVCLHDVRRLPRQQWDTTPVERVMTPSHELVTVTADQPATDALRKLSEREVDQVPVVERDGSLLGLVRRQDILRWLSLHTSARIPV